MQYRHLLLLAVPIFTAACGGSEDYTPQPGAEALTMFADACLECHAPVSQGGPTFVMELSTQNVGKPKIKQRISSGGFLMPGFPNIQGKELDRLAAYVEANSRVK